MTKLTSLGIYVSDPKCQTLGKKPENVVRASCWAVRVSKFQL